METGNFSTRNYLIICSLIYYPLQKKREKRKERKFFSKKIPLSFPFFTTLFCHPRLRKANCPKHGSQLKFKNL